MISTKIVKSDLDKVRNNFRSFGLAQSNRMNMRTLVSGVMQLKGYSSLTHGKFGDYITRKCPHSECDGIATDFVKDGTTVCACPSCLSIVDVSTIDVEYSSLTPRKCKEMANSGLRNAMQILKEGQDIHLIQNVILIAKNAQYFWSNKQQFLADTFVLNDIESLKLRSAVFHTLMTSNTTNKLLDNLLSN
ncbi:hypothetical protein A1QO_04275 [Vibrio genomosp. F10 str. ZF-129]|uniref:Uncharacterized protein n=1 Tax=Vibrio genomosp. F10 str. ZF-129 TaxID=1187848 RepID=A0A1E5BIQ6_9VIBR|nr:hypothetical protein [Vibrio genomosp. F10]OEE37329.1 hypothetical protein A1QO_04275 [Vibrio genomosp. F10 str. ZF-129]